MTYKIHHNSLGYAVSVHSSSGWIEYWLEERRNIVKHYKSYTNAVAAIHRHAKRFNISEVTING